MKKLLALILALSMIFVFAACGSSDSGEKNDSATEQEQEQTSEAAETAEDVVETADEAPTADAESLVQFDGNLITVTDDKTGTPVDDDSMLKEIVLTNKNIGYTTESGPFKLTIVSMQISSVTVHDETIATGAGLETDEKSTLVAITMAAENTSDETLSFYPDQSILVTNTKAQCDANLWFSDSVGGDFLGNVEKKGQVNFFIPASDAKDLSHLTLHISGPVNERFDRVGDDIQIEFELIK